MQWHFFVRTFLISEVTIFKIFPLKFIFFNLNFNSIISIGPVRQNARHLSRIYGDIAQPLLHFSRIWQQSASDPSAIPTQISSRCFESNILSKVRLIVFLKTFNLFYFCRPSIVLLLQTHRLWAIFFSAECCFLFLESWILIEAIRYRGIR